MCKAPGVSRHALEAVKRHEGPDKAAMLDDLIGRVSNKQVRKTDAQQELLLIAGSAAVKRVVLELLSE